MTTITRPPGALHPGTARIQPRLLVRAVLLSTTIAAAVSFTFAMGSLAPVAATAEAATVQSLSSSGQNIDAASLSGKPQAEGKWAADDSASGTRPDAAH